MFKSFSRSAAVAIGLAVVVAACGSSDGGDAGDAAVSVTPPDTSGAAIWAHIHEANYSTDWELWPEKGRLYRGTQPHGALLTTYLNDIAFEALTSGAASMPAGAVIVKENYMPDSTLAAVTTMLKVPGYNADHNDWFLYETPSEWGPRQDA